MFQNMTPGDLLVLAFGGLLAIATIVSTVGGAVEKVVKLRKAAKAPEVQQDAQIQDLKIRIERLERDMKKDEDQITDVRECNRVLTIGMLALLDHGINGNNIEQMQNAKAGVEAYLTSY